jgi:hypothetical protein
MIFIRHQTILITRPYLKRGTSKHSCRSASNGGLERTAPMAEVVRYDTGPHEAVADVPFMCGKRFIVFRRATLAP